MLFFFWSIIACCVHHGEENVTTVGIDKSIISFNYVNHFKSYYNDFKHQVSGKAELELIKDNEMIRKIIQEKNVTPANSKHLFD